MTPRDIDFTLLADGSSDSVLVPILRWALHQTGRVGAVNGRWADLRALPIPPRGLADQMAKAAELYPCDVLFVHRDAERADPSARRSEIAAAKEVAERRVGRLPVVCVVPVRMQEAWLLFDERAVRCAANNPNGTSPLSIHRGAGVEDLPSPKDVPLSNLRKACGLHGRHLERFRRSERRAVHRVAHYLDDFAPLRALAAFRRLEDDIRAFLTPSV
jgi:hypothetical protein